MILLCYDGSSDARAAIDHAGELLSGQPATVLTVWEPFIDLVMHAGVGLMSPPLNFEEIDAASEHAARERAEEGVERARHVGFNAQPRTRALTTTTADVILAEAEEVGAAAIVLGTRGLTGLKSMLLGSVSHALLQHADRTVIVVPSPEVSAARAARR
ncbi:MAG: universal stress protein [Solirubrobacteraceae bacterium]